MKPIAFCLLLGLGIAPAAGAQSTGESQALTDLIAAYAEARGNRDTVQLHRLLTADIDQLVSSGTWRRGREEAMAGMLRSSTRNPGERVLTVEHIRMLRSGVALVDARYEIRDPDGSVRRMWSSFTALREDGRWKIAAIRNMLPAR